MLAKSHFRTRAKKKLSPEERARFWKAVDSLSRSELLRLESIAQFRILGLGYLAAGRDGRDLLHEAIAATVDGTRVWKENSVPLFAHLSGAMRSIASAWLQKASFERRRTVTDQTEMKNGDGSEAPSPIDFESFPGHAPNPENLAITTQFVESMARALAQDDTAHKVFAKMIDGWKDKDIPGELGISRKQYEAAKKRIQRRLLGIMESEHTPQRRASSEVP